MSTSATTTVPPAQAKPRRRWWLRGVALVAFLILLVIGLFSYLTFSSRAAWLEAEAEADRSDPDWRLEALEAKRRVVPDHENSALHLTAVARLGGRFYITNAPNYDRLFETLSPTAQLNQQQAQLIRTQLAWLANTIGPARKLKDMPYGRNAIQYSPDYVETLAPWLEWTSLVADWLQHDALLLAHDEKTDQAIESCQAMLNVARTLGDEPFSIIQLRRRIFQDRTVSTLERVLAQGQATDAPLAQLQALFAKEINESTWQHGLRGERAGMQVLFDGVRTGQLQSGSFRSLRVKGGDKTMNWIHEQFPATFLKHYPELLQTQNRLVEISKLPLHEQRKPLAQMEKAVNASANPLLDRMRGEMNMCESNCWSQALLRSTTVALECERYRLRVGRWPNTLDDLIDTKYLGAIPLDPYNGQTLRYGRMKGGVVIYSVGSDLTDNQGRIDRDQHSSVIGLDQGFRLWDRDLRRQAPLPPVVVPE